MPSRPQPGLAWFLPCDAGFAVGLVTHYKPRTGHVVWIAADSFDDAPTLDDVEAIEDWRWPVLFPLGTALHRQIATRIGRIEIPRRLQAWPVMRSARGEPGLWTALQLGEHVNVELGRTDDRSLPIYHVVNDTRLKEMIVTGWRPEDRW